MPTDLSERALETRIVERLTAPRRPAPAPGIAEAAAKWDPAYAPATPAGGWVEGDPREFDRGLLLDVPAVVAFLQRTQPRAVADLGLADPGPRRDAVLARLAAELAKRGAVDVLRNGFGYNQIPRIDLWYGAPTPGNDAAAARHAANEYRVTRQVRYSSSDTARALDLVLLVNGVPLATFELKNRLTGQDVGDAVRQYQRDRHPNEPLFRSGRCAVHFAADENLIRFATELRGEATVFFPFDRGHDGGAGNPPNPHGLRTDWLWDDILAPASLEDIIGNYAQAVTTGAGREKKTRHLWPRYHQLDAVRAMLAHAAASGPGERYLIQHSAGSGKSNTIAWLVHQLIDLQDAAGNPRFDTVIVVTDRRVLDDQLRATIKGFASVGAAVGAAQSSGDLRKYIEQGKRIVISTVQKFPFILEEIGDRHRGRRFAIVIDEAHSSQGGKASSAINAALGDPSPLPAWSDAPESPAPAHRATAWGQGPESPAPAAAGEGLGRGPESPAPAAAGEGFGEGADPEDLVIEAMLRQRATGRRLLDNASYFAFTATPKNKTLEIFGTPAPTPARPDAKRPFHVYTMRQAIEEGFILDVLRNYTPVRSWYRLIKTVEGDPEYQVREAAKLLRRYVENNDHAIGVKARIAAEHFRDHVAGARKIDGKARAMVVVDGVDRAIGWWRALSAALEEINSPFRALIAFSGEREWGGAPVTETSLNGFPGQEIPERFRQDPYRFLVVADKFQTGYDEPLLHTMYVDKVLSSVKAVQTLSRLNRAHPGKRDTFILDFANDEETIRAAFEPYYTATTLSGATDPNKLHDLQITIDTAGVYDAEIVERVVRAWLLRQPREAIDPPLEACVDRYLRLDEDGQVAFKGGAKAFVRTYAFLGTLLPWINPAWERLFIFLTLLLPKLPAPVDERDDLRDLLEQIDLDSYRAEVDERRSIGLQDGRGALDPVPAGSAAGFIDEPEKARLSAIIAEFNDLFGNIAWQDADSVRKFITEDLPAAVAADERYRNAIRQGDAQNARIEHDRALEDVLNIRWKDHIDLYRRFTDDGEFRRYLAGLIFRATYQPGA